MKTGRASRTAELVCMGRALAHSESSVARFSDPTAFTLLPKSARARVERVRAKPPAKGLRAGMERVYLVRQSSAMVARTVAIDDAIRETSSPQIVILGAGLDGRAWRMSELADVVVFEVDHPDSQRDKRARVVELKQAAREVRFVAVDFERDSLEAALAKAGHDPARPTTWIWEGVVMYLTPADVDATLAIVARLSAPQSRLVVAYHSPAFILRVAGLVLRRIGEPLRSAFSVDAMRALLAKYGFTPLRDEDVQVIAANLSSDLARMAKAARHQRIVVADRSR